MYIGIDIGGTNLKAGLVDQEGRILASARTPLEFPSAEGFAKRLADLARDVMRQGGVTMQDIEYVGMGLPGAVSGGEVLYTANIPMKNVPLEKLFRQELDLPVLLANDADCAAAGEYLCGAGKGSRGFIVLTLGTGIGGGIILGGKLQTGMGCAGEVGHMLIVRDGAPCNCGRRGCWEAYASATGLIRLTQEAMEAHPESLLHKLATLDSVEGKTAFQAAQQGDPAALAVCRDYVSYLADGVINLVNVLQPEIIAIGGGVAAAPEELLLTPLQKLVREGCYSRHVGQYTRVIRATMGNDAGIVGAALIKRIL